MAVKLPSGFIITNSEPIDNRLVLTKAEMLATKSARMPDNYICLCKDDGKLYIYNKSATTTDPETGKFTLYEKVIDIPGAITAAMSSESGKAAMEAAVASTIPGALEETMSTSEGAQKIADTLFESEHFEVTLDNKIDLAISLIQAIDGN